jgi:hypothetical protein
MPAGGVAALRFAARRPAVWIAVVSAALLPPLAASPWGDGQAGDGRSADPCTAAWEGVLVAAVVAVAAVSAAGRIVSPPGPGSAGIAFGGPAVRRAIPAWWAAAVCKDCLRGSLPVAAFLASGLLVEMARRSGVARGGLAGPPDPRDAALAAAAGIGSVALAAGCRRFGVSAADAASAALLPISAAVLAAAIAPSRWIAGVVWCGMSALVVVGAAGASGGGVRSARAAASSPWLGPLPPQGTFRRGLSQAAMVAALVSLAVWLVQEPTRPALHGFAAGLAVVSLGVPLITLETGGRGGSNWRRLADARCGRRTRPATATVVTRVIAGHAAIAVWPLVVAALLASTTATRLAILWPILGCLMLAVGLCLSWRGLDMLVSDAEASQAAILVGLAVGGFWAGIRAGPAAFGPPPPEDGFIIDVEPRHGRCQTPAAADRSFAELHSGFPSGSWFRPASRVSGCDAGRAMPEWGFRLPFKSGGSGPCKDLASQP